MAPVGRRATRGRIERQGNLLFQNKDDPSTVIPGFEVEILAYVTKDTLDMRMWQIQEVKLKLSSTSFALARSSATWTTHSRTPRCRPPRCRRLPPATWTFCAKPGAKRHQKLEGSAAATRPRRTTSSAGAACNERDLRELPGEIEEARRKQGDSRSSTSSPAKRRENFKTTIDGKEYTDVKVAGDYPEALRRQDVRPHGGEGWQKLRESARPPRWKMQARLKELERNGGGPRPCRQPSSRSMNPCSRKRWDFQERAAPLDVTIDGQNFTARAKMVEFWRNITGDADGFTWTFSGEEYIRRTLAVPAASGVVAEAIADQKQASLGGFGPFALTIKASRSGGRREDKRIGVEAVLSVEGKAAAENLFEFEADVTSETAAERVLGWAHSRAQSLGSDLSWLESDLRKRQEDTGRAGQDRRHGRLARRGQADRGPQAPSGNPGAAEKAGTKTDDDADAASSGAAFNQGWQWCDHGSRPAPGGPDAADHRHHHGRVGSLAHRDGGRIHPSPAVPQAIRDEGDQTAGSWRPHTSRRDLPGQGVAVR